MEGGLAPCPSAPNGVPASAERRCAHGSCNHPRGVFDRQQGGEDRDSAHEVVGRVDRVDVPANARRALLVGTELLADDPVTRKRDPDPLTRQRFDPQVGVRHERSVQLATRGHAGTEELE